MLSFRMHLSYAGEIPPLAVDAKRVPAHPSPRA
jgi:hypothetical protein